MHCCVDPHSKENIFKGRKFLFGNSTAVFQGLWPLFTSLLYIVLIHNSTWLKVGFGSLFFASLKIHNNLPAYCNSSDQRENLTSSPHLRSFSGFRKSSPWWLLSENHCFVTASGSQSEWLLLSMMGHCCRFTSGKTTWCTCSAGLLSAKY